MRPERRWLHSLLPPVTEIDIESGIRHLYLEIMAFIEKREFKTRQGFAFTVRNPLENDAPAVLDLVKTVALENEFHITEGDEVTMTVDDERAWIERLNEATDSLLLIAELDNQIIGLLDFQSYSKRRRLKHNGAFGMSVDKKFRDQGVGRKLITVMLDWAHGHPTIEKASLAVLATNERAIALYRDMGFKEEGRRERELKLGPGHYVDDILMARFLKQT